MGDGGQTILVLLIILTAGLVGPELFKRLKFPYFSSLIILGAFLGPSGLGYVGSDDVISFFGFLGFTFLMFMAGLESNVAHVQRKDGPKIALLAILNGMIPALVGFAITLGFGYSFHAALVIGVIFISSSIAIIFPAFRGTELFRKTEGSIMISAVLFADLVSLVFLALLLHGAASSPYVLAVYCIVLLITAILLKTFLPLIARLVLKRQTKEDEDEKQLRIVIVILVGALTLLSGIGVHPILAAFIVGLLLSDVLTSQTIRHKIHTLGYGLFVPVFFFVVGMEMDLRLLTQIDPRNAVVFSLVIGAIISKFLSGYVGGRILKFSNEHSTLFGVLSTVHLTTALAATFAASAIGILDSTLVTAVIVLSVVTSVFSPVVADMFHQDYKRA